MGLLDYLKKNKQDPEQITDSADQTEEERALAAHVRTKIEEVRSSSNRIAHEGIWMTNIAYCLGFDGLSYNTASRQFQPINRASAYLKKNRLHVNKILPTLQNRLARLCKNPPKYDVRPETNDTEDKEAARLALQVLQAKWEDLHLDEKRIPLYMWVQETGHAWIKVSWDIAGGKPMVDPMTNELDYEGEVRVDIDSPFSVFPDPMAKTQEDMQWLIEAKVRPLDYFKMHYPERGDLVKEEQAWLLSAQYENRINSLNSRGPSQGGMQQTMSHSAIEMIKYEARSKKYPNGRMIVAANGILLEDKELPVGEIPFAKFDDIVIGGKFYSESIVTHLRPVQDQYNETLRRRAEWTKRLLAGKYRAARGSGLSQESLNDESGEILYYTPVPNAPNAGAPEAMQVPMIPQYAYLEEERLNEIINYISGISETSRGDSPNANMPAIGMQLLVEQDDTRIGVLTEQHEHAWARVGQLLLKHVEKFYEMPRKLKVAGKNLQYTVKDVSGSDLRGNTDVVVIRGSTLPGSKAIRRQDIINTFNQGLLGDPQDPKVREKVLGMMEFGDMGEMWQDYGLNMAAIKRGMEQIKQGISIQVAKPDVPVEVSEFDDHTLWIQELNRFRLGDEFQKSSPEIQLLVMNTIEGHLQAIVKLSGGGMGGGQTPPDAGAAGPQPSSTPPPPGPSSGQTPGGANTGIAPPGLAVPIGQPQTGTDPGQSGPAGEKLQRNRANRMAKRGI